VFPFHSTTNNHQVSMATMSGPPEEDKYIIRSYHGTYLAAAGDKAVFSKPDEAQVGDRGIRAGVLFVAWSGTVS
jgi:hypothetical protein